MQPIGYVIGTEREPNTAYKFHFWAERGAALGIGSMVKARCDDVTVYGTVVEAYAYNDVPSALADFLGREGSPLKTAPTARPEIRLYEAAVLRREPEEPVGAVGIGPVFEADADDVTAALGAKEYQDRGIPMGVYGTLDNPVPVLADPDFLLGPEAGHLNVTGTSGLAAKTSYIQFLLGAIFQKLAGTGDEGVAAVLFNVKGGDLLFLDHAARDPLRPEHLRMYEVCGLAPEPFENVTYWAPYADETGTELRTLRNHDELDERNETRGFCYGLKDVLDHAEVLLNREDLDVKADAFLQFLSQTVADKEEFVVARGEQGEFAQPMRVKSLDELVNAMRAILAYVESKNLSQYRSHHPATIRKMLNRLGNIGLRFPGLVSHTGDSQRPLPERFERQTLHVIDVAGLDSDAQDLVFAAVISDLRDRMERRDLGVGRLIVVVDELNKYAPSAGRETHVLRALRDIASRGRYLKLVMFGAQQFRSRVDASIVGNCASAAYGHIMFEELSSPIYSAYPKAVREKLATADPGEMMIRHPHFSQPVFVRFPLPSVLKGSDGMDMFPARDKKPFEQRVEELSVAMGAGTVTPQMVREGLVEIAASERDEKLKRILQELVAARKRGGEDPLKIIGRVIGRKPRTVAVVTEKFAADPDDPFA